MEVHVDVLVDVLCTSELKSGEFGVGDRDT